MITPVDLRHSLLVAASFVERVLGDVDIIRELDGSVAELLLDLD